MKLVGIGDAVESCVDCEYEEEYVGDVPEALFTLVSLLC